MHAALTAGRLQDLDATRQETKFSWDVAPAPQRDSISPFKDNGCRRRCLLQVTAASTPRSLGDPSKIGWNLPRETWGFPSRPSIEAGGQTGESGSLDRLPHTPAGGGYPVNELSLLVMIFLPSMMCLIGSWVAELMLEMLAPARKASATLTPATTG